MPVEAAEKTTVAVVATAFDERTSGYGCRPDGCTAENTRDNNLDANSRWSCKGDLVEAGSRCCIEYYLSEPQDIVGMDIAFYKGTENVRMLNVYNDGVFNAQLESSGSTSGYQGFVVTTEATGVLGVCLDDSESNPGTTWLSLTEVRNRMFLNILLEFLLKLSD